MRHWYTRYEISNALDRGTLAAVLARGHAARCAACQAFAARLATQHAQLRAGAAAAPAPAVGRARRPVLLWGGALALGAAAVVLALPSTPTVAPVAAPAPVATTRPIAARVSELFTTASAPLDAELENLLNDGRRGVDVVLATGGLRGLVD
jgi:NADPH:quinone reductase-like Zn-dependent oxidoreductase